jgi:hypothetical protein
MVHQMATKDMSRAKKWYPFSGTAYGPKALYIPCWGKPDSAEFIFQITQNYPLYATHPMLDFWHNYGSGMERFESPFEYRITSFTTVDRSQRNR